MSLLQPFVIPLDRISAPARLVLFQGTDMLVQDDVFLWPLEATFCLAQRSRLALMLDSTDSTPSYAVQLEEGEDLGELEARRCNPRQVLLNSSFSEFALAGKALQLLHWVSSHRFCGCCGARMQPLETERALTCSRCATRVYPRINPCVIVLVTRADELLLARHAGRSSHYFSCLAGFMEVGETPEETIHREVWEETALKVKNIRYISSQSWPFPSQLMLGFFADYAGGDIRVDGTEIAEAHWFRANALPATPPAGISVAGHLIELFLKTRRT